MNEQKTAQTNATNRLRRFILTILGLVVGAWVTIGCLYYFVLWASWDYSADFLKHEACLTQGGVWSVDQQRCWHAGQCEDEGGFWYPREYRCVFDMATIDQE